MDQNEQLTASLLAALNETVEEKNQLLKELNRESESISTVDRIIQAFKGEITISDEKLIQIKKDLVKVLLAYIIEEDSDKG